MSPPVGARQTRKIINRMISISGHGFCNENILVWRMWNDNKYSRGNDEKGCSGVGGKYIDAVFATSNIDWNDKKCLMGNDTGCPLRRAGAQGGLTTNKNN